LIFPLDGEEEGRRYTHLMLTYLDHWVR